MLDDCDKAARIQQEGGLPAADECAAALRPELQAEACTSASCNSASTSKLLSFKHDSAQLRTYLPAEKLARMLQKLADARAALPLTREQLAAASGKCRAAVHVQPVRCNEAAGGQQIRCRCRLRRG
jgi:hypothetical protein